MTAAEPVSERLERLRAELARESIPATAPAADAQTPPGRPRFVTPDAADGR